MAAFKNISPARIVTQRSIEGLTETGASLRFDLIETTKHLVIQRYEDGVGISTTTFLAPARDRAEEAFAVAVQMLTPPAPVLAEAAPVVAAPVAAPVADLAEVIASVATVITVVAEVATATPVVTAPVARPRGPNRPDTEIEVWCEGDLKVVMVQGRTYHYDLRRGEDTIEKVPATRAWRAERQSLIDKASRMLPGATA